MKLQILRFPAFVPAVLTATIVLTLCVVQSLAADPSANACLKTSNDVLQSCKTEAQSDYLLALARCDNAPGDAACAGEATAEKNDTLTGCQDEFQVRVDACDLLGPDPYDPVIDQANFVSEIDNPFNPLIPGTTFIYEGQTTDGFEHDEIAVTHSKRVVDGVSCTVVRDTVHLDGKLTEDTIDFFAQDKDGNVWYFGEATHELENGLITTIDGTFLSGVNRAKPGIIMEAHPKVGDFYRQEFDLRNAEDFAKVTSLNATVSVPFGNFSHCLRTSETTPLEPDLLEDKFYCSGVGNVLELDRSTGNQRVELIQIKHSK